MEKIDFHGGCRGCTMQEDHGVTKCVGCQYFKADWNLPYLNTGKSEEKERAETRLLAIELTEKGAKFSKGHWYSKREFSIYKYRAKFIAENGKGEDLVNMDVYTTNTSKEELKFILTVAAQKKFLSSNVRGKIVNWSSKEADLKMENDIDFLLDF